jgi:hypothetical protein
MCHTFGTVFSDTKTTGTASSSGLRTPGSRKAILAEVMLPRDLSPAGSSPAVWRLAMGCNGYMDFNGQHAQP